MKVKHVAAGVVLAGTLLAGGAEVADQQIDPYTTVGTQLEIQAESVLPEGGDQKIIADKREPKITLTKWNGEVAMGVRYTGLEATGDRPFLSKNVEWSDGNQKMEAVPLEPAEGMEDGGMEINIILNEKPTSNIFNFAIDGADNLDFFYQPPLTDEEIKEGAQRPDNVVGSYAVYYKNHANHIEGQTNYATGKAYHVFRPLVTDAKGDIVWADLSFSNGELSVTVPQSFLDGAVYPVNVDPTFGYTTQGASNVGLGNTSFYSLRTQTAAAGTVTQMSLYAKEAGSTAPVETALYDTSTLTLLGQSTATTINSTTGALFNFTISLSVTAQNYDLAFGSSGTGSNNVLAFYDTGSSGIGGLKSWTYPNFPASTTWTNLTNQFSIYATYTAAAAAASTPADTQINTDVLINSNALIQ